MAAVQAGGEDVDARPGRAPELIALGTAEVAVECVAEQLGEWPARRGDEGAEVDVQARLDQRQDEAAERVRDHHCFGMVPDGGVVLREPGLEVVARQVGRQDVVAGILEHTD